GEPSFSISDGFHEGSNLSGWINISLENENSDIELSDSEGNSIELMKILETGNYTYNCTPSDCGNDYETSGSSFQNKDFELSENDSVLLGFLINEEINALKKLSFKINSDASPSCENQIGVDFLDNNNDAEMNSKTTGEDCSSLETYGCYSRSSQDKQYLIPQEPDKFCQRINFYPAPGYTVGAEFNGESKGILSFKIYNLDGEEVEGANCKLDYEVSKDGIYKCEINNFSLIEKEEYYLCLNSDEKEEDVTIRGQQWEDGQGCGFYFTGGDFPPEEESYSYEMFSRGLEFDTPGELLIEKSDDYEINQIEDYISKRYSEDLNCEGKNCIIPVRINSNSEQTASISDISFEYDTTGGMLEETKMYELSETIGEISSEFQKINLKEANFSLPEEKGELDYYMYLGDKEILEKVITIGEMPKINDLSPKDTFASYPTSFEANISLEGGIEGFYWDFGDGNQKTTTTSNTEHTYNSSGE
ncbi:MAG: PKD domain-containing protein, partial [Minisyncoccales bacterium]